MDMAGGVLLSSEYSYVNKGRNRKNISHLRIIEIGENGWQNSRLNPRILV